MPSLWLSQPFAPTPRAELCPHARFDRYVEQKRLDPYAIMLTICDADSLFAPRFLEMLEWTFRQQCNPEYAAPPSSRTELN